METPDVGSTMTIPTTSFCPMSSTAGHGTDTGEGMSPELQSNPVHYAHGHLIAVYLRPYPPRRVAPKWLHPFATLHL
eukprot:192126-Rhodomonas_salina.1